MRNIFSVTLMSIAVISLGQNTSEKRKLDHRIEIKTSAVCEMCKEVIERDLSFEKGVKSIRLDVQSKLATVIYNPKKTNPETIRKRITRVGYNADKLKRDPKAYEKLPLCCKDDGHHDRKYVNHPDRDNN